MILLTLSADAMAPFARVLRASDGRFTDIPEVLEQGDTPGHHAFAILCPAPVADQTVRIASLERHPHSTQSFLPIRAGRWIVLVAPTLPDGLPDIGHALAFLAGPGDAVCIRRNVWHAGLTVLDGPAEFGMIMWRTNSGDDGIVHDLATPLVLTIR